MEDFIKELFNWVCQHEEAAPFFLFLLLLLSGLALPISEDLILIGGGMISTQCFEKTPSALFLFFMLWLGCILSAWEAYWIGRIFGPKLFRIPIVRLFIKPRHVGWAEQILAKYGVYSFIVCRFVAGGVRNALFMTSGFTKMPFNIFVIRDLIGSIISTTLLFGIGVLFGRNIDQILSNLKEFDKIILGAFVILLIALNLARWLKNRK